VCCCSVIQRGPVWCRVLQRVTECCSVLQCVAVRCSALQCVAVRCSALRCVAVRCSALHCVAVCLRHGRPTLSVQRLFSGLFSMSSNTFFQPSHRIIVHNQWQNSFSFSRSTFSLLRAFLRALFQLPHLRCYFVSSLCMGWLRVVGSSKL